MSTSCGNSRFSGSDVNTKTLTRIGGSQGVTSDKDEFSYIISSAEDDIDNKLRQLKRFTIGTRLKNFNTRYLELYDLLETTNRVSISVIDYENAL
ncbi:hypothetical protein H8356DRAFT_1328940 [Neocallimastix lanati (nom. inval.)]|nr:hypothetical protein H8356DRAFT_1328940 [Neocallimastix sp. JGI-2020a]